MNLVLFNFCEMFCKMTDGCVECLGYFPLSLHLSFCVLTLLCEHHQACCHPWRSSMWGDLMALSPL